MEITKEKFQKELKDCTEHFYSKLQYEGGVLVRPEMKPVIELAIKMGFVRAIEFMVGEPPGKVLDFKHE